MEKIKELANEYFLLEKGALIEKYSELLKIGDISGHTYTHHPHDRYRIYISRRALKHFVEERKEGFLVNHSEEEALAGIYFGIDMILDVITDFDRFEQEPKELPQKYFYSKDYSYLGKSAVRVLVEKKGSNLEIRSIHFQTRTNK